MTKAKSTDNAQTLLQAIEVYAIDAEGNETRVKASELKLRLMDGGILHVLLDAPDGVLIGTPADEIAPARLVMRPGGANAVSISVERDIAAAPVETMDSGELDLTVQYVVKPKGTPGKKLLRTWASAALAAGLDASVTLRIVDEEEGRQLNHSYREKDYATNVLSFAFNDGEATPGLEGVLVGDVVFCAPVIAREAKEQGKTQEEHWAHLVVHGMLHLQGYDHEDEVEAEAMEALETAILSGLGYADPYASEKVDEVADEA